MKVFSPRQIKAITEYATNTYFRHYPLYSYVFTKKVKLDFMALDVANKPVVEAQAHADTDESVTEVTSDSVTIEPPTSAIPLNEASPTQDTAPSAIEVLSIVTGVEQGPTMAAMEPSVSQTQTEVKRTERMTASESLRAFIIEALSPEIEKLKVQLDVRLARNDELLRKLQEEKSGPAPKKK
ncbi:hypothetical protein HDU93_003246 [Gonapodya sp. JEL0774]|nr:hypothetical protein HDU93_003246 [Gonapodya sp. JEL0774]